MADKTSSVRINADPKGFIAGTKQMVTEAKAAGSKIEGVLTAAAEKSGKAIRDSTGKFLKQGAAEGARGVLNELRDVESKSKGIFDRIGAAARKAFGGAAKMMGGGANNFLKGAGIRGGPGIAEGLGMQANSAAGAVLGATVKAVTDANAVLEKATRISIGARGAGQEGANPQELMSEFYAIAQDVHGVTAGSLADATAKYVGMTGDLATARSSMKDFALAAQASGASVEDVAGTAAAISQQFGITDPGQIRDVLSALIAQGKSGAFELKDAASLFPGLAAAGASFGLDKGAGGVKTLGGIVQIARQGSKGSDDAATNVVALLNALKTRSSDIQAAGTKIYEGTGANKKTRDLPTILAEMIAKTGGTDLEKKNEGLTKLLTDTGFKAVAPLVTQYQDMFAKSSGKTDQARQAEAMEQLRQKIMENVNAAGSWSEVQKDAATAASTASAKTTAAWERFSQMTSEKILPQLLKIADKAMRPGGAMDAGTAVVAGAVDTVDFVSDKFMWLGKMLGDSNDDFDNAQQKFAARDKVKADLQAMQMRPEEIAQLEKTDPEKLKAMRAKATDLKAQADVYDADAQASWKKFSASEQGKEMIADGYAAERSSAPVEVKLPDKEMRVRITNPKEVGGAATPGAPTPGWVPR